MLPPPNHPHPQILPIDTSREDIKAQLRKSQLGSRVMFLQKVWKVWEALELGEGSQLGSFVMFLQKVSGGVGDGSNEAFTPGCFPHFILSGST